MVTRFMGKRTGTQQSKRKRDMKLGRITPKGTQPAKRTRHTTKTRAVTMVKTKDGSMHMVGAGKDVVIGQTHIRMTQGQAALVKTLGEKGLMADTQAAVIAAMAKAQSA